MRTATIAGVPDATSDVLSLVRMRCEFISANEYSTPWCYDFRKHIAHFHIVERGTAFLTLSGREPLRMDAGDLAILPLGASHTLGSEPGLKPVPIEQALARGAKHEGTVYRMGGGGPETHVVCGQFAFEGALAPKFLNVLPPVINIAAPQGRPFEWLRLTSNFLIEEARRAQPGFVIMVARLLDLLFIQAVREWGGNSPKNLGWLSGLSDPSVGRALSAIHDEPARRWTVERLAALAGLSRSAFAARFAEVVGTTPLKYLAAWRLELAAQHLRAGTARIGEIAAVVGYGSETALTRAFKAQFGMSPARFRRTGLASQRETSSSPQGRTARRKKDRPGPPPSSP